MFVITSIKQSVNNAAHVALQIGIVNKGVMKIIFLTDRNSNLINKIRYKN